MSDLYSNWEDAQAKMKFWKAKELELRNEILEELACQKDEGVVNKIIDDLKISATYKLNRKIDVSVLDAIWKDLEEAEKIAIKYKPDIVMKELRDLEKEGTSKLLNAIIITPGQGTIKIKHN